MPGPTPCWPGCTYSRAMDQPLPRRCVVCGCPEPPRAPVPPASQGLLPPGPVNLLAELGLIRAEHKALLAVLVANGLVDEAEYKAAVALVAGV